MARHREGSIGVLGERFSKALRVLPREARESIDRPRELLDLIEEIAVWYGTRVAQLAWERRLDLPIQERITAAEEVVNGVFTAMERGAGRYKRSLLQTARDAGMNRCDELRKGKVARFLAGVQKPIDLQDLHTPAHVSIPPVDGLPKYARTFFARLRPVELFILAVETSAHASPGEQAPATTTQFCDGAGI